MKTEEFVAVCINKEISITNVLNGVYPWYFYRKIAKLTEHIDYGCDFNNNGVCKQQLIYCSPKCETINMCCCSSCRFRVGYHKNIELDNISIYAENFDYETGFWRKDVGCVLPRVLRSPVCLFYKCTEDPKIGTNTWVVFHLLRLMNTSNDDLLEKIMHDDVLEKYPIKEIRDKFKDIYNLFVYTSPATEPERIKFIEILKEENKTASK